MYIFNYVYSQTFNLYKLRYVTKLEIQLDQKKHAPFHKLSTV